MKFIEFNIKNFKGIKNATINLQGGRIFTLVGLNEGGKTTLLEAIHSFSPDADTELVVGSDKGAEEQKKQWVPRDKVAFFTGDVLVSALVEFEEGDVDEFIKQAKDIYDLDIKKECFQERFVLKRMTRFENGDLDTSYFHCSIAYEIKSGKKRKYRDANDEERRNLLAILNIMLPRIAYFPTFVFDFPSKIYLTEGKGGKINNYYRKLFQDILDYDSNGLEIDKSIVNRIRKPEARLPWGEFISWLHDSDEKSKIQQVVTIAERAITSVIFDRWRDVFKEDVGERKIVVSWEPEEGINKDENGNEIITTEHDLYITIEVEHETQRFEIKDRSLGFRWFFTFLLFTQFRVARSDKRPIVFLFDEPASNLHAAAQQKLVESFSEIATDPHVFIYTTHSHYMIEPKWLEQTYIVQNGELDGKDVISESTRKDHTIDIEAIKYRTFVNSNPSSVSYFQPIMDRLNVAPSKLEYDKRGVILEGKSDQIILRYLSEVHFEKSINFFPGVGATTLGALISLQKGWGFPVLVLLDFDKAGKTAKRKYINDYALQEGEVKCLGELVDGLTQIESFLEPQDMETIKSFFSLDDVPKKEHIYSFFQENLAGGKKVTLSDEMTRKAKELLESIEKLMIVAD